MVNIEERIARMLASGTLNADQAASMRASIDPLPQLNRLALHKKLPLATIMFVLVVLILLILMLTSDSSTDQTLLVIQNVAESINQAGGTGAMQKYLQSTFSLIVILLPLLLCVFIFMYLYNNLVGLEEEVFANWSQVESQYQRRADLIPNLVNTVKGYAEQEKSVLVEVTAQRAKLAEALASLKNSQGEADELSNNAAQHLDDDAYMARLAAAQNRFSRDVVGIFALTENYPELKSSDNFMALQDQLEGTENRINIARIVFNETVRDYNKAIRVMPGSLVAGIGSFKRKAYFEVDEESKDNVKVDF
jgi:LemA protein